MLALSALTSDHSVSEAAAFGLPLKKLSQSNFGHLEVCGVCVMVVLVVGGGGGGGGCTCKP